MEFELELELGCRLRRARASFDAGFGAGIGATEGAWLNIFVAGRYFMSHWIVSIESGGNISSVTLF